MVMRAIVEKLELETGKREVLFSKIDALQSEVDRAASEVGSGSPP
jgi:hypothetical protein